MKSICILIASRIGTGKTGNPYEIYEGKFLSELPYGQTEKINEKNVYKERGFKVFTANLEKAVFDQISAVADAHGMICELELDVEQVFNDDGTIRMRVNGVKPIGGKAKNAA